MQAISKGKPLSRIVYAANLSYDRVVRCVNFLVDQGMIEMVKGEKTKLYELTERGREVINLLSQQVEVDQNFSQLINE